ncbi:hypothetical protein C4D60_Mb11t19730 [Musa balbisiana]|uniref:Uncharacterized protein n=1 Tax=Musa balbisiana TaxID=52838 RepID=A0A4V4H5N3_MUSBA|nr:hypothetical protein C4D60_Mb11t19730 [Musa balbisiana]
MSVFCEVIDEHASARNVKAAKSDGLPLPLLLTCDLRLSAMIIAGKKAVGTTASRALSVVQGVTKGESSDQITHIVYLNLPSAWLLDSKMGPKDLSNHRAVRGLWRQEAILISTF